MKFSVSCDRKVHHLTRVATSNEATGTTLTEINHGTSASPGQLTEEQRAAAFANAGVPVDRAAALRAGRAPVPPKFFLLVLAAFVVLGGGGVLVEHYFGRLGAASSTSTTSPLPVASTRHDGAGHQISSSLWSLLGYKKMVPTSASALTLTDQHGATWALGAQRGKVVVLTFFNATCNDICPVLGAELRRADQLLGAKSTRVVFAVVNTDPNETVPASQPPALEVPGLLTTSNVHFLTGSLNQLNPIWSEYGVAINVGSAPSQVAHNNIMYFIDPEGKLRSRAIPFGNEDRSGHFTLQRTEIARFAKGIAQVTSSLIQ